MWWTVYLYYVVSACNGGALDFADWQLYWPSLGALLLTLLFQGSTALTERITVRKYPLYANYQQRVPKFLLF